MNTDAGAALFADMDFAQRRKSGQSTCGDRFVSRRTPGSRGFVAALSDGLGSGVKASVLSTMAAVMAVKFAEGGVGFPKAAGIIMKSLPVCSVRRISYATFSIAVWSPGAPLRLVEMGNPLAICVRGGALFEPPYRIYSSDEWAGRRIRVSELEPEDEDRVILISDGISQAGMGIAPHCLGWRREGCARFLIAAVSANPSLSSRALSRAVLAKALSLERGARAGDDMSCAALHFRHPRKLLLAAGPPFDKARDPEWAASISSFQGAKALCGGSTARIVSRELGLPIRVDMDSVSNSLPPMAEMEGFSLVTEGILTLTRTAQLLEGREAPAPDDPASRLAALLRDHDSIHFIVGNKVNEAHQDPSIPLEMELRRAVVRRIDATLRERFLKETSISYV